jgi:hypothetical protein
MLKFQRVGFQSIGRGFLRVRAPSVIRRAGLVQEGRALLVGQLPCDPHLGQDEHFLDTPTHLTGLYPDRAVEAGA